jgi:hypothetical protein
VRLRGQVQFRLKLGLFQAIKTLLGGFLRMCAWAAMV